ncbi:hypothetical protein ACLQ25_32890, partial [Micromonospora sp. DT44]|uniref:hypothetical protein n=1 Tax=Micromonospora sp. DT44 TaxID=3393439 RepID=UPI003CF1D188
MFGELRDADISVQRACLLTGTSRATYYRRAKPVVGPRHGPWLPRTPPPQALSTAERDRVLAVLNSPTYADLAIPQVWAR